MKKRYVMLLCLLGTMLVFGGCGKKAEEPEPVEEEVQEEAEEPEAEEPEAEEPEETEEANEESGEHENMIENGDFSQGLGVWQTYLNNGEAELAVNDEGQMEIRVANAGDLDYSVQAYYDGFSIDQGVKYHIAFDLACDKPRTVVWRVQVNGGDYHAYFTDEFQATEEMQHYDYDVTMEEESDPAPRLCFNVGKYEGDGDLGNHVIKIDNLEMYVTDDSGKVASAAGGDAVPILVNQVGYPTGAAKVATFRGDAIGDEFEVVDAESNKSVGTYKQEASFDNSSTQEKVSTGDFSELKDPGTYKIVCGDQESAPFVIGDDVYQDLMKSLMNLFYLHRCGTELTKDEAGAFAHPVCHDSEATVFGSDEKVDVTGGWHDAGDYGRYVVAGAKAACDLMMAWEDYGDATGDILEEVKYELDWMLKMQREDGGVYHKVTCANFPDFVSPEQETGELILSPVSNAATADFAATMAMASRIYRSKDSSFADGCLEAAQKAFVYLQDHQEEGGFTNPDGISTGEYGDGNWKDEYFWAAAELFRATSGSDYDEVIKELGEGVVNQGLGWGDTGLYGAYAYVSCSDADEELSKKLLIKMESAADSYCDAREKDGYGSAMLNDTYPWGSNMTIANDGMLAGMLRKLGKSDKTKQERYDKMAADQLNYLLGRNGTGYCYVTGFGTISPKKPHHRPSTAAGECMPGMLVGGPDNGLDDPYVKQVLKDKAPALCYADSDQSYSTNEITIYWNSPLVYLLASQMK
ncbi:MAG: glycoside hydrolase family 9 protein [Lachnospiraceae bacterium]|nr:glycoside hydrolase family 9 protein [Lachnospiraceae bacterium]